MGPCWT